MTRPEESPPGPPDGAAERERRRAERTRTVWQPRAGRPLTPEDAREIEANVVGFFRVLAEWDRRDRGGPAPDPATTLVGPAPPHGPPVGCSAQARETPPTAGRGRE